MYNKYIYMYTYIYNIHIYLNIHIAAAPRMTGGYVSPCVWLHNLLFSYTSSSCINALPKAHIHMYTYYVYIYVCAHTYMLIFKYAYVYRRKYICLLYIHAQFIYLASMQWLPRTYTSIYIYTYIYSNM